MYVIRLANGRLLVPHGELAEGEGIAQAYVEIGPDDPDYARLAEAAVTEEEMAETRKRWRREDDELRVYFEKWRDGLPEESTGPGTPPGPVGD